MDQHQQRLELQQELQNLIGAKNKVYYQPTENIKLVYPCIVYERNRNATRHAGNSPYFIKHGYQVTVISPNVDEPVLEKLEQMEGCTFDRRFVTDGLYHDVFSLFY